MSNINQWQAAPAMGEYPSMHMVAFSPKGISLQLIASNFCRDKSLLNGAVRAYLTSQGYKLTALTFSEEGGSSIPATLTPTDPTLFQMFQGNYQKLAAAEATEVTDFRSSHGL